MDRLVNLMADESALTELWFEEKAELSKHPKAILPLQNETSLKDLTEGEKRSFLPGMHTHLRHLLSGEQT